MNDTNLGSDSEFNRSNDNDSDNERDSVDMKITTAKPMAGFKRKEGDPNMKGKNGGRQKQRVTVLNQTNGGMQPWHKMAKTGNGADDDFDEGLFNRHEQQAANEKQAESETNRAEFDGGILLLDAEEAINSIMDDESNHVSV